MGRASEALRLDVGAAVCRADSGLGSRLLAAGRTCRSERAAPRLHRWTVLELHRPVRASRSTHAAVPLVEHERAGHRGGLHRLTLPLPSDSGRRVARGHVRGAPSAA
ncbi:hypothetical protein BSZ37_05535 [Rubrivirga marina]|uniref:Uncharacterized protein n=1 Tax=Rubrivirga marina TaxID=1196024 RepID=A0A271IZL7_9BACT|nr:hypothetical protein BSZ37_05535 [Rubrivirga marina]